MILDWLLYKNTTFVIFKLKKYIIKPRIFIHHLYKKGNYLTAISIILFLEAELKMSNNNSNNQNRTNYDPYLKKNVIREVIDHLMMTMTFKSSKQNLLINSNNIKLAEKCMFHIQVSNIYCQIFFMNGISFKPMLFAKNIFIDSHSQKSPDSSSGRNWRSQEQTIYKNAVHRQQHRPYHPSK